MVESGLERKKSQPAMLASLALVYFFRAGREPVRKRYQLSQIIQQSPVYRPNLPVSCTGHLFYFGQ